MNTSTPTSDSCSTSEPYRILWVDDEPQVITSFERLLRSRFAVVGAHSGEAGIHKLQEERFSVVITDMTMPEMDGIEFLRRARRECPEVVCVMLTGNQDRETVIQATNEGEVFRFLNKPVSMEAISEALMEAVTEHEVRLAKKELLDKTLTGCVQVLTDVVRIIDPLIFSDNIRTRSFVKELSKSFSLPNRSAILLANMLSGIGLVSIPTNFLIKFHSGEPLTVEERKLFARVPVVSESILSNVPRMEEVRDIILYLNKNYDGTGYPKTILRGEDIPWGSRFLRIAKDLVQLQDQYPLMTEAIAQLREKPGWYDPKILDELESVFVEQEKSLAILEEEASPQETELIKAQVSDLRVGQRILSAIETKDGVRLLEAGEVLTDILLERINNYSQFVGVKEPIYIDSFEPAESLE